MHTGNRWALALLCAALIALSMLTACSTERGSGPRVAEVAATPAVPAGSEAPVTTSLSPARLNAVVDSVLRAQYPDGFDGAHECWKTRYSDDEEAMSYCMRALPAMSVTESRKRVVCVALGSAADIEDDADYRYGAADPGMFNAFRVVVAPDGTYTLAASGKGMDFGMAGDCGCADADFVASGPNVHGWVFSNGGTQQGIRSGVHSVVAPAGDAFKDVTGFPRDVEGLQDVEYRLAIGSENASGAWFPLTVSKYRKGERLAAQTVHFDPSAGRYLFVQPL